jgi:hypothetical protein
MKKSPISLVTSGMLTAALFLMVGFTCGLVAPHGYLNLGTAIELFLAVFAMFSPITIGLLLGAGIEGCFKLAGR